jgi:phage-related protein
MAKGSSFGGTVKLNGEDEYKKALRDITSNLKLVSSELKLTNTEFSNGDKNIKQAKTSYDSMKNTLQSQKDKVKELKEALSKMEKEYGSNNETVRLFKTQLNNAENQLKQMEDATDKSNKELKEMKKGFEDAGDGALKFSDVLKANVLGDVIVGGLKKIGSATLEIGKAFLDVGKQALDSYANYEQLVGGVETLFKDSANIVEDYANNAYKNAGLSANDYMETVTSFSASLLQSLNNDTAKSAEVADMAITDMSDNANKMGTDMSMIQNAYQGFAKQNYTMLDNLKLGYGGTKSEMERLLADAEKISGIKYDISSFADITQAIHVMQEEMGITGTTAKEAGTTIEGSVNSMKSAWQNLLTDLANGGKNMGSLIENLMTTIFGDGTETNLGVFGNVLPVIQNIVSSFADVIPNIVDKLMEHLPYLLDAASEIIMSLVYGITENIPALMPVISDLFGNILQYIIESLPIIINSGVQIILALVQGIGESLPTLIPALVDAVVLIVETLIDNIDLIIDAGIQLILGLADGLIEALPRLIDKVPEIIEKLFDAFIRNFPKIVEAGGQLIGKLIVGIIGSLGTLYSRVPEIIHTVVKGISSGYQTIKNAGLNLVAGIWEGISGSLGWIKNKIKGWVGNVTKFIKNLFGIHSPSKLFKDEIGTNLALGIGEGFTDTMTDVQQEMADAIPTKFDTTINSKIGNNSYQNVANSGSFDNMVIAFKTALKDVKVIMDEKEMGTFVTNAVEEVVYS